MLATTIDRPLTLAPMSQREAEQITTDIKNNFDSLGSMLMQARDRRAYKALGYSSFEEYCNLEFGKSVSRAYQLIEDTKTVERLSAAMSEELGESIHIAIPSSHLQPLKRLNDVSLQIQAIKQANKLAEQQGKKTTKQYIELAVHNLSGEKSENFREAIKALGFTVGTEIEVVKNKGRGFIRRIDKTGKIQVQLHNGGAAFIPYGSDELRILQPNEKPKTAINEFTSKGSKVKIYSNNFAGKTGEITQNLIGSSHAKVKIEGGTEIELPYAELELIENNDNSNCKTNPAWKENTNWTHEEENYYYIASRNEIHCTGWPVGLKLEPYSQGFKSPAEFTKQWLDRFSSQLIRALPNKSDQSRKAVGISFGKTLDELLSGQKTQTRRAWQDDYAKNFIRYWEEGIEIPALDKQRQYGGREIGKIRLTEKPYQQLLSEMPLTDLVKEGAMCATVQEFIDTFFEGQNKLVWVISFEFIASHREQELEQEIAQLKARLEEAEGVIEQMAGKLKSAATENEADQNPNLQVENSAELEQWRDVLVEDFCPGQLQLFNPELTKSQQLEENFSPATIKKIQQEREKLTDELARCEKDTLAANKKNKKALETKIANLKGRLGDLDKFQSFKIGQKVSQKFFPERRGEITGFLVSQGGMPMVWVKWKVDGEDKLPITETVGILVPLAEA